MRKGVATMAVIILLSLILTVVAFAAFFSVAFIKALVLIIGLGTTVYGGVYV